MNKQDAQAMLIMNDPSKLLSDLLIERKAKNPSYSARAMARDFGISISFLSQILNRKRNLSLSQKLKFAEHLGCTKASLFEIGSAGKAKTRKLKLDLINSTIAHERIIRYWYHFAILEMISGGKTRNNPQLIAKRLGISELEAVDAVKRLIEYGYVELVEKDVLKTTGLPFMIQIKSGNPSVREYYASRLKAAEQELLDHRESRTEGRYYQNLFITTTKSRAAKARKLISKFQENLISFLAEEKGKTDEDEIYQLSLQLFSAEKNKE